MTGSIMQPTFNPWLGYFDLIDQSDVFVLYDDVQLARRSWQVRNKIRAKTGELFLTIPVRKTACRDDLLIKDAELSYDENWQLKHLRSIENSYSKAVCFEEVFPLLQEIYLGGYKFLSEFNRAFIASICDKIAIRTKLVSSSVLRGIDGNKDVRLAEICKKVDIKRYISPQGAANYIEKESPGGQLKKQGILVNYHVYKHPSYRQVNQPFMPYMGVFDLLLNEGFSNALTIIRSGRCQAVTSEEVERII